VNGVIVAIDESSVFKILHIGPKQYVSACESTSQCANISPNSCAPSDWAFASRHKLLGVRCNITAPIDAVLAADGEVNVLFVVLASFDT
jgi:hypothetical protein